MAMPPQKKKSAPMSAAVPSSALGFPVPRPGVSSDVASAAAVAAAAAAVDVPVVPEAPAAAQESIREASPSLVTRMGFGGLLENADAPGLPVEVPAAVYQLLAGERSLGSLEFQGECRSASGGSAMPTSSLSQEDYVTVVVTPKLTFQLLKRPEWQTVEDITQSELRRGFLSRFPPALWLSSEKFSFRPALPPTHRLTEDTKTLFFKSVSDEVADEKVMLGILRELEKSYEAIIRRAVTETRSEALQEQFLLQEQAEEVRREQAKHIKELKKEIKSLREQMQSIQKRLFLVEQEKDNLQR
jgi:hypothetical protein